MGTTRPNPSVGAVIVVHNKVIAEGFTSAYGGPHAEVNAIQAVKDISILKDATMYVTLEPCAHFGKTPPCADLIVKHQLKKVVIGCKDTNELVAGKGIEKLQAAGIDVTVGVLEAECLQHHKRFFRYQNKKRPYIILKWAQTADNFIAPSSKKEQKPIFISNAYSQQLVHQWRSEEQAILVGTTTAMVDNPKLNVRSFYGNNPVRVVLDKNLRVPATANLFDQSIKTIVITAHEQLGNTNKNSSNISFEGIDFSKHVSQQIGEVLYKHHIQSVIIEGGLKTLQTFIDDNYWDEARVFTSELNFGAGVKAPNFKGTLIAQQMIKSDKLKTYFND